MGQSKSTLLTFLNFGYHFLFHNMCTHVPASIVYRAVYYIKQNKNQRKDKQIDGLTDINRLTSTISFQLNIRAFKYSIHCCQRDRFRHCVCVCVCVCAGEQQKPYQHQISMSFIFRFNHHSIFHRNKYWQINKSSNHWCDNNGLKWWNGNADGIFLNLFKSNNLPVLLLINLFDYYLL